MTSNHIKPSDIFRCKDCGDCCKGFGGTVITENDVKAISKYIKFDPNQFPQHFCQPSGNKMVLTQGKDGYCIFWDGRCSIHPVKPRMCRQWPFIESVLIDINNWQIMAGMCPGIRSDISDAFVKECVAKQIAKESAP